MVLAGVVEPPVLGVPPDELAELNIPADPPEGLLPPLPTLPPAPPLPAEPSVLPPLWFTELELAELPPEGVLSLELLTEPPLGFEVVPPLLEPVALLLPALPPEVLDESPGFWAHADARIAPRRAAETDIVRIEMRGKCILLLR